MEKALRQYFKIEEKEKSQEKKQDTNIVNLFKQAEKELDTEEKKENDFTQIEENPITDPKMQDFINSLEEIM
jgi:hypothetical protein